MHDWKRMVMLAAAIAATSPAAACDDVRHDVEPLPDAAPSEALRAPDGGMALASKSPAAVATEAAPDAAFAGNRKLIRSVELGLEVEDVPTARAAAERLASELGGFLSAAAFQDAASGRPFGRLTLRVPAERLEEAIGRIEALGEVTGRTLGSQDVTRQYLDTETRLRVLRETDARLRRILADRTGDLAEVLQVERELSRVVTEIEQLEGQKRFWDEQVDLATIQLSLRQPAPVVEAGWFAPIREAFAGSVGILARSVAWLITALAATLPFGAAGLLAWLAWRLARRGAAAA